MLFHHILVSHNHIKTEKLLLYLLSILTSLNRFVHWWVPVFFLVCYSSYFGYYRLDNSMFSLILCSFLEHCIIHQLKKYLSKSFLVFFLSSVFISMHDFNQVFWLNLMILCTFLMLTRDSILVYNNFFYHAGSLQFFQLFHSFK